MLRCALCRRPLMETAAWKGRGERYYCNEFCAEAEEIGSPTLVPKMIEDAPSLEQRGRATSRTVWRDQTRTGRDLRGQATR